MSSFRPFACVVLCLLLSACGQGGDAAVPLGDHAALQRLAEAWEETLDEVPTAPGAMRPEGRLRFVQAVFRRAGYDYDATLAALARDLDASDKDQRDLADLVLMPVRTVSTPALPEVMSRRQAEDARRLRQRLAPGSA